MISFDSLLSSLPPAPTYPGQWAPIYLEPMMASGESLTIAVAARGRNSECRVCPAIRPHVLDAMFGQKSAGVGKIIALACSSLQRHLQDNGSFEGWAPPVSGMRVGRVRETVSSDILGLLRQAVALTASLAAMDLDVDDEEADEVSDVVQGDTGSKRDPWPKQFESAVLGKSPRLSGYFNATFHVSERARPSKIFYLSERVALNTGKLIPGSNLSSMLERNKARLLDLLTVRDRDDRMIPRAHYELVVFRPGFEDPTYSERQVDSLKRSIEALEEAGDKHSLRVQTVESAEQAAERLFAAEAA